MKVEFELHCMYTFHCNRLSYTICICLPTLLQEEEKKENNNDKIPTSEIKLDESTQSSEEDFVEKDNSDSCKSPVRTRLQNKMDPPKPDKPKPVKKTVTFGTVESCEDIFLPLKKLPLKHHAPLVPIIKKKSALKQTEYSTFNSILKPAKLTDLSSRSTSEYQEGYLKKNLNPLSKSGNKFTSFGDGRPVSPPPRTVSPIEKDNGNSKFLIRSSHSSRVIKPNKRFVEGEDQTAVATAINSCKVLKKPKLKRLVFNNIPDGGEAAEKCEKGLDNEKAKDKQLLASTSSSLFKDKTVTSFSGLNSGSRKASNDVFSYEKEDQSQDENSNLEESENLKAVESSKEDKGGHAMRKLMDISDASSSSSSTTSDSESEESWDSDSPLASGDEENKSATSSPEREKTSASQLLSGKVIIREARLQLSSPVQTSPGLDGPFSAPPASSCKLFFIYLLLFV